MNKEQKEMTVKLVEYNQVFKNESGTEVEFKIKTECRTLDEMQKTLSFIAQSSHRFYLELAKKVSNML